MKNKKLIWFLIVVVAGVWGLILYRIFASVGNNDDISTISTRTPQKEVYNDFTIPKDTTKLLLNYRDPFGLTKQKDTTAKFVKISRPAPKTLFKQPGINWSFISYSGYICNPSSKKLVTLVNINGQNLMLIEGETKSQVKLIKNLKDSIEISYQGKTKFIVIKSTAL